MTAAYIGLTCRCHQRLGKCGSARVGFGGVCNALISVLCVSCKSKLSCKLFDSVTSVIHMMSRPASTANPHVIVWTGLLFKPGQNPRKTCHIFSVQTGMNPGEKLDTSSNVLNHMDRED